MSSNFWTSSHSLYHLQTRQTLNTSRAIDLQYASPRQIYCLWIWFSNLIYKIAKRLALRQQPIATAMVYFRRFYLKNSICETNPYLVLAACLFVAAKVEETPVHIKSVVTEAKMIFSEVNVKTFPAETNKLGEMEFYLLEDLDFHLVVFHPYRALLHITGREPADGGRWNISRLEEDMEMKKRVAEAKKRREEDLRRPGTPGVVGVAGGSHLGMNSGGGRGGNVGGSSNSSSTMGGGGFAGGIGGKDVDGGDGEETDEARIRRLMSRGSGEGLMEIEEGVVHVATFILNDTYRTDVHLLYPPYIIALSALYISYCVTAISLNKTGPATRSSTQLQSLATSLSINSSLGLPSPPTSAAEFISSFQVSLPILFSCIQDIIVLYPIWETFEPQKGGPNSNVNSNVNANMGSSSVGGGGSGGSTGGLGNSSFGPSNMAGGSTTGSIGATTRSSDMNNINNSNINNSGRNNSVQGAGGREKFGPEEAEALVRKMIEERMVDVSHPENAGLPQLAGRKRKA